MSEFFLSGAVFTLLYLLPLVLLHVLCEFIRYLNTPSGTATSAQKLRRININIYRYLGYMLAAPAMMLLLSVMMGYLHGFDIVKNSMIWLIVAITIAFAWIIYRLVRAMGDRGRFEAGIE